MSASTILGAGSAIAGAVGSYYSAKGSKAQLKSQARISDINARIAEMVAQGELARGQGDVAALTRQAGQLKSRQRVALAANGVDLGEGNAAELQASTDLMKEVDMNTVTANAVNAAWGYRGQAVNARNDALMKRATASGISPGLSAATSLLGSASNVAKSWYMDDRENYRKRLMARSGAEDFVQGWTPQNYG